jgi:branched-subunit amino acid aminotransferase/4-amino-4-deoxychorismate lyase
MAALSPGTRPPSHVLSHVVSYASSVFEGIRCYATPAGPAIFRLPEHVRRMMDSIKIYRMPVAYTAAELADAMQECYPWASAYARRPFCGREPLRCSAPFSHGKSAIQRDDGLRRALHDNGRHRNRGRRRGRLPPRPAVAG